MVTAVRFSPVAGGEAEGVGDVARAGDDRSRGRSTCLSEPAAKPSAGAEERDARTIACEGDTAADPDAAREGARYGPATAPHVEEEREHEQAADCGDDGGDREHPPGDPGAVRVR